MGLFRKKQEAPAAKKTQILDALDWVAVKMLFQELQGKMRVGRLWGWCDVKPTIKRWTRESIVRCSCLIQRQMRFGTPSPNYKDK